MNLKKLLEFYPGQTVKIVRWDEDDGPIFGLEIGDIITLTRKSPSRDRNGWEFKEDAATIYEDEIEAI